MPSVANSIRKTIVRVAESAANCRASVSATIVANWSMICVFVIPMNNVDITETNHLSFCAGYGGIDLALKSVVPDGRTIAYVEIEAFAIANLVAKMEAGELDQAPVWTDVKTFPAEEFHGLVDIVSGGYPCQPFSAAGKRLGTEDPRHLWPYIRRAIRSIRPGRVFLENVEGHISLGLSTVISDLDEDGYRATWGIFSAAECGAPHQRKRVFILGELANTRHLSRCAKQREQQEECAEELSGGDKLADSRCVSGEVSVGWKQSAKPIIGSDGEARRTFPARPGQPQFDWEEPRTVADTKSGGIEVGGGQENVKPNEPRQAEPQLGRATDGCASRVDPTANRVDRLRLLGNGVVPATAAKAWIELSGRFE